MLFESNKVFYHNNSLLEWDTLDSSAIHLNVANEWNHKLLSCQQKYLLKHRMRCHANDQ